MHVWKWGRNLEFQIMHLSTWHKFKIIQKTNLMMSLIKNESESVCLEIKIEKHGVEKTMVNEDVAQFAEN